jgi:hypothetical protein
VACKALSSENIALEMAVVRDKRVFMLEAEDVGAVLEGAPEVDSGKEGPSEPEAAS